MRILGIEGLTPDQLDEAIQHGGRFVFFEYCISCVVFTLRRPSVIVFLPYFEWGWVRALPYTVVSVLLGWWGLPWGVLYTPLVLANNLAGGCDVTAQTRAYLAGLPQLPSSTAEDSSCDLP